MPGSRSVGRRFEDAAAEFLAAQGYTLLTRRFKAGGGEVDLVCLDGPVLAFVEVKARLRSDALESIDLAKQSRIISAAEVYLARYDAPRCEVRFDIVAVDSNGMTLYRDAFRPR